jgi:hypothetical protein
MLKHPEFFDYSKRTFSVMYDLWFFGNPSQNYPMPLRVSLKCRTHKQDMDKYFKVYKVFKNVEDVMTEKEKEDIIERLKENQTVKTNIITRFLHEKIGNYLTASNVAKFFNSSFFTVYNKL